MTFRTCGRAAVAVALVAWSATWAAARQAPVAPVFTAEQAKAGRDAYAKSCASCHMPDLSGNNEVPALAGATFMSTWGRRSTKELFDYMSTSMPYGGPSLTSETYTSIAAYILKFNGASEGPQALSPSTTVALESLIPAAAR